ncbi:MAG: RNA polymerase sigma factor [Gammaproteobacteria bacterium]|nr:RNA polymerase sigma factor [Gammaproteobacteria bacterium]MDH5730750.1 RNA polymerase sigma factor [Gammaproteobacteria bacterium]
MSSGPSEPVEDLLQAGYRYAMSICHQPAMAEDLLQEAWYRLLKADGPRIKPYLFTTIRNIFYNQYKREKLVSIVSFDDESQSVDASQSFEIDYAFSAAELEKILTDLKPIEREALYLQAVEGFSVSEVAQLLDVPRGTVHSLIFRAKKKLLKQHAKTASGVMS